MSVCMLSCFSRVWLFVISGTIALQAPLSWDSPGKSTGVGCHALLQGIFLTRGSSQLRDQTGISYVSCIGRQDYFLPSAPRGKPLWYLVGIFIFTFGQYRYHPLDHTGWSMGGHDIQARMITDSGFSCLDWISNCFGLQLSLLLCLQQGRDQKLLNTETEWVHSMERNRIKDRETARDKEESKKGRGKQTTSCESLRGASPYPPWPRIIMLRVLIKSFFLS